MNLRVVGLAIASLIVLPFVFAQGNLQQIYAEAKEAEASGNLAQASAKYEEIVRLQPQLAEAYANLGNLYYQQSDMARAKAAYTKALALKPSLGGPEFFLGAIAFRDHDFSGALRHLRRAKSLQPNNALVLGYLGYTEYARNDFHAAAQDLESAMALNGSDVDVIYHLGRCYSHLAQASFRQLKNTYPDSAWTDLAKAHAFEAEENEGEAKEQYRLALEKMPTNIGGPETKGALAYKDLRISGAQLDDEIAKWRANIETCDKVDSGDKQAYQRAEGYQVLAYLLTDKLLDADPNSYRAHQLQAQLLEAANKDAEAIAEYRKVLELKPDLQNIHFAIGSLYWKAQAFEDARKELDTELKENPNHPQALYELGDIAAFNNDSLTAEKDFQAALRLDDSLLEARLALEKLYTQNGEYSRSVEQLKKVLIGNPAEPRVHYRLAMVYRKLGRTADADRELAIFNQQPAVSKSQSVK